MLSDVSLGQVAFVVLVVVPMLYYAREIPERLHDIWDGRWGILATPITLVVGIPLALIAYELTSYPVLGWGWLGHNFAAQPISDSAQSAQSGGATTYDWVVLFGGGLFMVGAFIVANYREEEFARTSWKATAAWALLHLIMGIDLAFVIPIFGVGVVLKLVYDRYGLEEAYVAHLGFNMTLLMTAVVLIALL